MRTRRPLAVGQPTRGKTALNRLRQVDIYIMLAHAAVLTSGSSLVVDVGYGAQAWTALEMAARWATLNPALRLLGLEIAPDRVAAAQPYADPPRLRFELGGFNVLDKLGQLVQPLGSAPDAAPRAQIIRAYNVLRQYDESEVPAALALMGQALAPDGLLIEGTSNPTGRMVVFDVYRKTAAGLTHVELVFGSNLRQALEPTDFQTILPKRLIHHALDDAPAQFFEAWRRALQIARGAGRTTPRQQWIGAVTQLAPQFPIDSRPRILRRGFLVLRDPLR